MTRFLTKQTSSPRSWLFLLGLILGAGSLVGLMNCSGSGSANNSPKTDENLILQQLSTNLIVPSYAQLSESTQALADAANALCDAPSESGVLAAQEAWRSAKNDLRLSDVFNEFGPYQTLNMHALLDFRPTDPINIEAAITNNATFPPEILESLGSTVRGLPAIEYLLFDPVEGVPSILNQLSININADRRCNLLVALSEDAANSAEILAQGWAADGGNFALSLSSAGQGSDAYPNLNDVYSPLVNAIVNVAESIKDMSLGEPLGTMSGGVPQPQLVESPYSLHSKQDILNSLQSIENLLQGNGPTAAGLGFYEMIENKNESFAENFLSSLQAAIAAVEAIPDPLSESVVNHPDLVNNAIEAVRVVRDESVTMASLFGVSVAFNDQDGD